MSTPRTILGLSLGSALEGIDVAVVRVSGIGLNLIPKVERAARIPFPAAVRDAFHPPAGTPYTTRNHAELARQLAETASQAVRGAFSHPDRTSRDVFAIGLLEPHRLNTSVPAPDWPELADRVADQTGLTVVHGFRGRDRAGGGAGHPITAASDYLLFRDPAEERVLIHLGAVTTVVWLPANGAKIAAVQGFDTGPGLHLLDALISQGTRGRETTDAGGKRAVQGCCREELLARWREHPFFSRKPPRTIGSDYFGASFVNAAFDTSRGLNIGLPDLLCTATHFIAHSVGESIRRCLPAATAPRRIVLSGDGVRNGFLWQMIGQQFEGQPLTRLDELGVPMLNRNAAGAALLAALLVDGVPGNLPLLTGASGARLSGHLSPGDVRNWSRCAAWLADQAGEFPRISRAA